MNSTRSVGQACLDDHSQLLALLVEANKHAAKVSDQILLSQLPLLTTDELAQMLQDPQQCLLVVREQDKLLAALIGQCQYRAATRWRKAVTSGYLEELIVAKQHRQQGLAKLLIEAFSHWAKDRGADRLELHVWAENSGAIACYQALGLKAEQLLMSQSID